MKVRFSPNYLQELIEFEVELNAISIEPEERRGKDVIVRWKFYNGFDPKGKFWTDSNSLQMEERELYHKGTYEVSKGSSNITENYYPVTQAIAMRD